MRGVTIGKYPDLGSPNALRIRHRIAIAVDPARKREVRTKNLPPKA
jgi:hypothetical protein